MIDDHYDEMMERIGDRHGIEYRKAQMRAYEMGISPYNAPLIDGEKIDPMRKRHFEDRDVLARKQG